VLWVFVILVVVVSSSRVGLCVFVGGWVGREEERNGG
jgi:hypothetical protein